MKHHNNLCLPCAKLVPEERSHSAPVIGNQYDSPGNVQLSGCRGSLSAHKPVTRDCTDSLALLVWFSIFLFSYRGWRDRAARRSAPGTQSVTRRENQLQDGAQC